MRRARVRWGAAALALLAVGGYVTLAQRGDGPHADCSVADGGLRLGLARDQAANAATIGAVAVSRDLPERALTIALATAMQESDLRDLSGGDRDSLGLFQQRPSQGWGTRQQILDPVYSANEFFDQLVRVPGYSRLPLTVAAQQVQHSGFPQAYAKHENDASLLAGALSGRAPSLTCRLVPGRGAGDARAVADLLRREFGARVLQRYGGGSPGGGSQDGGGSPAASPGAASPDAASPDAGAGAGAGGPGGVAGTTVTVPGDSAARPTGQPAAQHGWALAQWAVAHSDSLRIARVRYRGRVWTAAGSAAGWRTEGPAGADGSGDVRITVRG